MDVKIQPSLFAADFYNLSLAIEKMKSFHINSIHFDIMDNHFVPNISFGPKVIKDIQKHCLMESDVHLMIDLKKGIQAFLDLHPTTLTVHCEDPLALESIQKIKDANIKVGVAIRPSSDLKLLNPFYPIIDQVLVMSVEPGFSGQSFIKDSFERFDKVYAKSKSYHFVLQGDGGINKENIKQVISHHVSYIVMGSAFFEKDPSYLREYINT